MRRLLIAESSELFALALEDALSGEFEICTCFDGCEALRQLQSFRPDAMILDLHLPLRDGCTVLRQSAWRTPVVVAHTFYCVESYIMQAAQQFQIGRVLMMPQVNSVVSVLMELLCQQTTPPSLDDALALVLHDLGFLSNRDGYRQLLAAIVLFARDPKQGLKETLYPAIAGQLGVSSGGAVEFSIRKAIQKAWERREDAVWCKYFAAGRDGSVLHPSNKQFLAQLVHALEQQGIDFTVE